MACPEGTFVEPSCCCFYKCNRLFISIHCSTKGSTTKLVESNRSRQNFVILFLLYIRRCLSIKDPKMGWQFGTLVVLCFFCIPQAVVNFPPIEPGLLKQDHCRRIGRKKSFRCHSLVFVRFAELLLLYFPIDSQQWREVYHVATGSVISFSWAPRFSLVMYNCSCFEFVIQFEESNLCHQGPATSASLVVFVEHLHSRSLQR